MATIYMPLLNEGTDVWRPVDATPLSADTYRVEGEMPNDEQWMFAPGTIVHCKRKMLTEGEGLTAIGSLSSASFPPKCDISAVSVFDPKQTLAASVYFRRKRTATRVRGLIRKFAAA
jgi:hypothetical protein